MISARGRVFFALLFGISLLVVIVAFLQRRSGHYRPVLDDPPPASAPGSTPNTANPPPATSATPVAEMPPVSSTPVPGAYPASPTPSPSVASTPAAPPPPGLVETLKLIVPVAGVQPNQLRDTFTDSRSEGRAHDAIDIPAAQGTPVVAAADGQIIKLFQSERGGTTIYQLSTDKKLIFYYAHLQRYGDGLTEGKFARQGEVIGYVGDTGNAEPGNYHLHFSIAVVSDPKRYWEGTNINPYPLLRIHESNRRASLCMSVRAAPSRRSLIVQARSFVSSHDCVNRGNTRPTSVGTPVAGYSARSQTRRLSLR